MKRMALLCVLVSATWACSHGGEDLNQAALDQCAAGQTVLYAKVTPPSAGVNGASGIADAPAVLGGGGPSSAPATSSGADSSTLFASTTATCVPAVCPPDQVAVPQLIGTGSSSSAGTSGAIESPPVSPRAGTATPTPVSPPATPAPATIDAGPGDVICTSPPPECPAGQAPSYAPAGYWHCMPLCDANDPNLVVISYGGIYGNGGICAGPPPQQACSTTGQVWTWNYLNEDWECAPECDNGQYDQHTFGNQTVCVPC
jgi:hypothetical protein